MHWTNCPFFLLDLLVVNFGFFVFLVYLLLFASFLLIMIVFLAAVISVIANFILTLGHIWPCGR